MENQEVYQIAEGVKEVIIRHGSAPDIKQPKQVVISGTITAPAIWAASKLDRLQVLEASVVVDLTNLSITLIENERFEDTAKITGTLTIDPLFKEFGINGDKMWSNEKLSDFIKMNRSCFSSKETAMKLVSELKDLNVKVEKEVESSKDNRGSVRKMVAQNVISCNIPQSFMLQIPIFKNQKPVEFEVEIYIDPNSFQVQLISPEANDFIQTKSLEIMESELDEIRGLLPNVAIIYK